MIEVNLLPGGQKRGSGGGFSLAGALASLRSRGGGGGGGGGGGFDPYMGFCIAALVVSLGLMGYRFMSVRGEAEELAVQVEEAVQDSIRNAAIIQRTEELQARGDSIEERVRIIQSIDQERYVWPHLLDEVASAVPDFTWLREIIYQSEDPLVVRIAGRAGSIFAITQFMGRLEGSPFLRAVNTETIQETPSEQNSEDLVYMFELTLIYESPSVDQLQTVPLFGNSSAQAQSADPGN